MTNTKQAIEEVEKTIGEWIRQKSLRLEGSVSLFDAIKTALKTQEQLENGYVMVRDVNVVSVTCPCGNTIKVNRNIAAQENDDE